MGADLPGKRELGEGVLARAVLVACDHIAQCRTNGELQWLPTPAGHPGVAELGHLLAAPPSRDPGGLTAADLTGTGMQDTVILNAVMPQEDARPGFVTGGGRPDPRAR